MSPQINRKIGFIVATIIAAVIICVSAIVVYYSNTLKTSHISKSRIPSLIEQNKTKTTQIEHKHRAKSCLAGILIYNVSRAKLNFILNISHYFGIVAHRGSGTVYVIFFVSPTCPFCKTEILALYKDILNGNFTGNPTIIVFPVPEHGLPDVLNVATLLCILNKYGNDTAFRALIDMYHRYYTQRDNIYNIYYPNIVNICKIFNVSLDKCIGFKNMTIVYRKVSQGSINLYASFINCTKEFYEKCINETKNSTKCIQMCYAGIYMKISNSISRLYNKLKTENVTVQDFTSDNMFIKSIKSDLAWFYINKILGKIDLRELGTPEIMYINVKKREVLVYIGLQIPFSEYSKYSSEIWSVVVPKSIVPREIRNIIYNTFTGCLDVVE